MPSANDTHAKPKAQAPNRTLQGTAKDVAPHWHLQVNHQKISKGQYRIYLYTIIVSIIIVIWRMPIAIYL